jgi:hypothetical protein
VVIVKKKKDGGEVLLRVIIFGSFRFLSKKNNQTETGSNRPVLVRFFRAKTSSNRFDSVFLV